MDGIKTTKYKGGYFQAVLYGIKSLFDGLTITLGHLKSATKKRKPIGVEDPDYFKFDAGIVTTEYPYESIPVPDNGRYRLHNEMDDCIVCDLCAKICPVNCIDIVPIKSPEEIGKTSDGTTKRIYASTFDIDMAKCCYCGLCTTVCPTECLTMTKTYDFSEFDVKDMTYHFTNLSPEEAEAKRKIFEEAEALKKKIKEEQKPAGTSNAEVGTVEKKVGFKPVIKTAPKEEEKKEEQKPKPAFKPVIKPKPAAPADEKKEEEKAEEKPAEKPKPVFKPIIKPPKKEE